MNDWDEKIEMLGILPVHWSVTLDEQHEPVVFLSEFQQLPDTEEQREELGGRLGFTYVLHRSLTQHSDAELSAGASIMVDYAVRDWVGPKLRRCLYVALHEQRERLGGFMRVEDEPEEG